MHDSTGAIVHHTGAGFVHSICEPEPELELERIAPGGSVEPDCICCCAFAWAAFGSIWLGSADDEPFAPPIPSIAPVSGSLPGFDCSRMAAFSTTCSSSEPRLTSG